MRSWGWNEGVQPPHRVDSDGGFAVSLLRGRVALQRAIEGDLDELVDEVLLALGQRWVEAGWLTEADEIFFLFKPEFGSVLSSELPGSALAMRIEDRLEVDGSMGVVRRLNL